MTGISTENLINHDGQVSFVMLSAFNSQIINAPLKLTRMSEYRARPASGLRSRVNRFVDLVPQDVIDGISCSPEVIHVCQRRFISDLTSNNKDHNPRTFEDLLQEHLTINQSSKYIKRANVHLADYAIENMINWVHAANQWANLECIHNALFSQKIWTPWHKLPDDIIGEVIKRISLPRDFLNFAASCKSWHSIAQEIISCCPYKLPIIHIFPRKCPLPMILQTFNEPTKSPCLYSIINQKTYDMPHLGLELGKMWIPVRNGWIVTIDFKVTKESKINLLNPLSNSHLRLPSCSSFLLDPIDRDVFRYLNRVIVVSPNSRFVPNRSLVIATVGYVGVLHFCRIGDDKWKYNPSLLSFDDLTLYKGLLCAVTCTGALYGIKIYPDMKVTFIVNAKLQASKHYIVESLSGELLLISRLTGGPFNNKTIAFKVYQLQEDQGKSITRTWREIESLHGQILFVGYNGALCFDSTVYHGIEGNCVYFTHDFGYQMCSQGNIGVYYMEDKRIEYFTGAISNAPCELPTTWFSPNW